MLVSALGLSIILNLVLAFFLALSAAGRSAPTRLSAKAIVDRMRAKDEERKDREFFAAYGRPRGVPDRLPRTTKRIVADPARECPVVKVEMATSHYGYWQAGDKSDEPFLAFHYPKGGKHGDLVIPVDAYVVDLGLKTPLRVYPGESFRKQCTPALGGVRVMGTNSTRPTHPVTPPLELTPLEGPELSENQLDALAEKYQLGGFPSEEPAEKDMKALLQAAFISMQSPPCAGEPVPQIGFPESPVAS
jgi:hypothetical protein